MNVCWGRGRENNNMRVCVCMCVFLFVCVCVLEGERAVVSKHEGHKVVIHYSILSSINYTAIYLSL